MKRSLARDISGWSLTELLITVALIGIVTMTGSSLVQYMMVGTKITKIKTMLEQKKKYFETLLHDPVAWQKTIAANNAGASPIFPCLATGNTTDAPTLCTANAFKPPTAPFILTDANGTVVLQDPGGTGFDANGSPCAGYPSSDCGAYYQFTYTISCGAVPTCARPTIGVNIFLNPNTGSTSGLYGLPSIDFWKYSVFFTQQQRFVNDNFEVAYVQPGGAGGGVCNAGWNALPFTQFIDNNSTTATSDSIGYATIIAGGQLQLVNGSYRCVLQAPSWNVDGFRVQLLDTSSGQTIADATGWAQTGAAASAMQAYAVWAGSFTLNGDVTSAASVTKLTLQESCQASNGNANEMGVPPAAGAATYATLSCTRFQ